MKLIFIPLCWNNFLWGTVTKMCSQPALVEKLNFLLTFMLLTNGNRVTPG